MSDTRLSKERKLEILAGFRPIDDDFMRALFKDNIPLTQEVVRIILGKEDLEITKVKTQEDMKQVAGAKSIALDIYAKDSVGILYNIEVQRSDSGADIHRARYHSSVIDVENLDKGHNYNELPETYVIFITENDTYGDGKPVHLIKRIDVTTGKDAGDGTNILYVNGKYQENCIDNERDELGWLMHDFQCSQPGKMHHKQLAEKSKELKESPEGVEKMCKEMEKIYQDGRKSTLDILQALKKGASVEELIQKGYSREEIQDVQNALKDNQ